MNQPNPSGPMNTQPTEETNRSVMSAMKPIIFGAAALVVGMALFAVLLWSAFGDDDNEPGQGGSDPLPLPTMAAPQR
jgi:hypothetical protein